MASTWNHCVSEAEADFVGKESLWNSTAFLRTQMSSDNSEFWFANLVHDFDLFLRIRGLFLFNKKKKQDQDNAMS